MYDLDPESPHLVKSELLLDRCFLNQDLQSPIEDYFLLNQRSSLLMWFAYLANIYVFILSSVPNEFESELKMSNISPRYKIKLLLWFLF